MANPPVVGASSDATTPGVKGVNTVAGSGVFGDSTQGDAVVGFAHGSRRKPVCSASRRTATRSPASATTARGCWPGRAVRGCLHRKHRGRPRYAHGADRKRRSWRQHAGRRRRRLCAWLRKSRCARPLAERQRGRRHQRQRHGGVWLGRAVRWLSKGKRDGHRQVVGGSLRYRLAGVPRSALHRKYSIFHAITTYIFLSTSCL